MLGNGWLLQRTEMLIVLCVSLPVSISNRGCPSCPEGLQCSQARRARLEKSTCHQGLPIFDLKRLRQDPIQLGMVLLHLDQRGC